MQLLPALVLSVFLACPCLISSSAVPACVLPGMLLLMWKSAVFALGFVSALGVLTLCGNGRRRFLTDIRHDPDQVPESAHLYFQKVCRPCLHPSLTLVRQHFPHGGLSAQKQSVRPKGFSLSVQLYTANHFMSKTKQQLPLEELRLWQTVDRTLGVQVWEQAALQSEFMVGRQSSDGFDPELCYRQDSAEIAWQSTSTPAATHVAHCC